MKPFIQGKRLPAFANFHAWAIAFGILLFFAACKPAPEVKDPEPTETALINDSSWVVPIDVPDTASQVSYYEFGWQTFVAINWPADPTYRGKPAEKDKIGATAPDGLNRPVVWQTWQDQYSTFLANAVFPGLWNDRDTVCNGVNLGFMPLLQMTSKATDAEVQDQFDEATGQPLIDMDSNFIRYEVRLAESEYQYFLNTDYYNANQQAFDVHLGKFVGMPKGNDSITKSMNLQFWAQFGSTEVKAAWRILPKNMTDSQKQRYFRTRAVMINSMTGECTDTAEVGLVGLHILRLTPSTGSTWYWATFEHVDNLQPMADYGGADIRPTFNTNPPKTFGDSGYSYIPAPIKPGDETKKGNPVMVSAPPFQQLPDSLQAINLKWSKALAGTPFQYYMMVNTVNPVTVGGESVPIVGVAFSRGKTPVKVTLPAINVNTGDCANSTMETYVYPLTSTSNCVICHAGGTPQFDPQDSVQINGNVQVFTFLFGKAQDSAGVRRNN